MARPRTMAMTSWILYMSAIALFLFSGRAAAQELCVCSPSTYTFTLDFSLTCPPVDVTRNPGITATFCQISPFGEANETITDLVPVEVQSIGVLELGQNFEVLSQTNLTGPFVEGDEFSYESLAGKEEFDGEIPKVIQLNIFAENEMGEPIVNFYAISYSNSCEGYPTLIEGDSAGWTYFTTLADPSRDLCPAVPTDEPTDSPTDSPTDPPPTEAPVVPVVPTEPPTIVVTTPAVPAVPTEPPTIVVTTGETPEETEEPTEIEPTEPPTDSVTTGDTTEPPTDDEDPTPAPSTMSMQLSVDEIRDIVMEMVMSMSMSMDVAASTRVAAVEKSAKTYGEKSHKAKSAKSEKKAKSDKKAKSAKSAKSDKKEKSAKTKSAKKEKRRRLRVRPIYQAD